jgi:hypothetical protein
MTEPLSKNKFYNHVCQVVLFSNEISYNIAYNSGVQDDISFIIEDDTFLVGDLRSTVSWSLVGQHVILYVEILNEKNHNIILTNVSAREEMRSTFSS